MITGNVEKRVLFFNLSGDPIQFSGAFEETTDPRQTLQRLQSSPELFSAVYVDENLDGNVYSRRIQEHCLRNGIQFIPYQPPFQVPQQGSRA